MFEARARSQRSARDIDAEVNSNVIVNANPHILCSNRNRILWTKSGLPSFLNAPHPLFFRFWRSKATSELKYRKPRRLRLMYTKKWGKTRTCSSPMLLLTEELCWDSQTL